MRPFHALRALGAAALVGGLSLTVAPTATAAATPVGNFSVSCQTGTFTPFTWNATVTAEALTEDGETYLELSMSALPGVVPLDQPGTEMTTVINAEVNGAAVTLNGAGVVNIEADKPFDVPAGSVVIPGSPANLDVVVTKVVYDIPAFAGGLMATRCPAGSATMAWDLDPIAVNAGSVPSPSPTPTPTPSPTPSKSPAPKPSPTKAPKSDIKGKPAKGTAKFDCTLQTIGSPFKYHPTVTLEGARASEDDDEAQLRLKFSDIVNPDTGKGLAPVPMDADMKITATVKVDGKDVDFAGSSKISAGPYEAVAVPVMTKTAAVAGETVPVEVTAFKFDFGELAGTQWFSDCKGGGALSDMTIGIGKLDPKGPGGSEGGDGADGAPAGTTTLPKTGGGDAMPVIALWALALGVVGAGLLVWLPAQRRSAS